MIVALKALHIAALGCWVAGLLALPLLLHAHGGALTPRQYQRYRLVTHIGYIGFATPAALLTIIAGTALIFAAKVFEPWLLVKLVLVAGMVLLHVWFGHLIQRSGEERRSQWHSAPMLGLVLALPVIACVLGLVLVKPDLRPLADFFPDHWLVPGGGAAEW